MLSCTRHVCNFPSQVYQTPFGYYGISTKLEAGISDYTENKISCPHPKRARRAVRFDEASTKQHDGLSKSSRVLLKLLVATLLYRQSIDAHVSKIGMDPELLTYVEAAVLNLMLKLASSQCVPMMLQGGGPQSYRIYRSHHYPTLLKLYRSLVAFRCKYAALKNAC